MTTATETEKASQFSFIAEFGQVPDDLLDLANRRHELRMYRLSTDRTKGLSEAIGFAAQFDSPDVPTAFVDIVGDEAYFNFEMKFNTRPQSISLRYKNDRWDVVEARGSAAKKIAAETSTKNRNVKTVYHAFLEAPVLEHIASLLRMQVEPLSKLLIRINFKDKTLALVAREDAVENFPDMEAFKTAHIERIPSQEKAETMNEVNDAPEEFAPDLNEEAGNETSQSQAMPEAEAESKEDEAVRTIEEEASPDSVSAAAVSLANEEPVHEESSKMPAQVSNRPVAGAPGKDESRRERQANPAAERTAASPAPAQGRPNDIVPKYHTYSQSEVDALIKRSADNITSTVTTKINAQTKAVKENLKNQEYAFNQALDKLTKNMEEANARLDKAANELNSASAKQMESFRGSLNKELDDFKTKFNKEVMPGIKLLDARLEQLAEAKKKVESSGGANSGMLMGVMVAVAIVSVVNLFIGWYAFERISNLEKSQSEMTLKAAPSSSSDVPIPDLMKDQGEK